MVNAVVNYGLRAFQIIFAAAVLGLSVDLIRGQAEGASSPIILRFAAFVGGVTLLAAFVGIATEFVSMLQGIIIVVIDAVVTLINIAGGIALAIKIGDSKCSDTSDENRFKLKDNYLFSGGCAKVQGTEVCYNWDFPDRMKYLNSRCMKSQADSVFQFLIVAILFASMAMTYLRMKKGY